MEADGLKLSLEANLDIETVIGMTYNTPVTVWSTGGEPPFIPDVRTPDNSNEPYLGPAIQTATMDGA